MEILQLQENGRIQVLYNKWWKNTGIDPTLTARALWLQTHPLQAQSAHINQGIAADGLER